MADAVLCWPVGNVWARPTRYRSVPHRTPWLCLAVSIDGVHLFVAVGAASNVDVEPPPAASVLRMRLDGSNRTLFATGLRRPGGLAVSPHTGDVFVSVVERDGLGDGLVPDFLTQVSGTVARCPLHCTFA